LLLRATERKPSSARFVAKHSPPLYLNPRYSWPVLVGGAIVSSGWELVAGLTTPGKQPA